MLNRRTLLAFVAVCLTFVTSVAQTQYVQIRGHLAHPTRILARYADSPNGQVSATASVLSSLGLQVSHTYAGLDGLVLIDEAAGAKPQLLVQTANPAQTLLDRIAALRDSGAFEYVEPDWTVKAFAIPSDAKFTDGTLWGLRNNGSGGGIVGADINATAAWDITTGSTNVIIAVIDTGIRYTHVELAKQMWTDPTVTNAVVHGTNTVAKNRDPFDDNDHGTHVSGTIGAAANDGNPHVGVNWQVQLMACKFLGADGFGQTSDAIGCITYAVAKGAKILNNSWGGGPYSQALFDSIKKARDAGVLFVAAAGNDANNNDTSLSYPASYQLDNIIAVAALDRGDNLATFSNYGRTNVHLGAPGVDIYSSTAGNDREYQVFSGTSMASPHVAGVAGLILAKYPRASLSEIKERLLQTVVPIASLNGITTTGGRVNAYNALVANPDGVLEVSFNPPSGASMLAGVSNVVRVTVTDFLSVTNATVQMSDALTGTSITFKNDGTSPDLVSGDAISSGVLNTTNLGPISFRVVVSAPGKIQYTNVVTYNLVPPPPNDKFANAAKITTGGGIIQSLNSFASIEPNEPLHAGVPSVASLWWNFSVAQDGDVLIDTTGSSFDTVIGVYTGTTLNTLKTIASADDVNGRQQAYLTFHATAGTTYRIAIAGAGTGETGTIQLRVEPNGVPDITSPIVTITSPASGTLYITNTVRLDGIALDPVPSASGIKEVQVKLNAQVARTAFGTTNWFANMALSPGANTVTVRAADFAGNVSNLRTITLYYQTNYISNDAFALAKPLSETSGKLTSSTANATKEPGEPKHTGNDGGKSLWWSFTPSSDGVLFLSTTNSAFDTMLGLYTGPRVDQLTLIADNDDAYEGVSFSKLSQAVQAGKVYYVAVDGYAGVGGAVSLTYEFTSDSISLVKVAATAGGSVKPGNAYYANGSTALFTAVAQPGYEFTGWSGLIDSVANPVSLRINGNGTLTAHFVAHQFADDLETGTFGKLPWSTPAGRNWVVQTNVVSGGKYAFSSGVTGDDQANVLKLDLTTRAGRAGFDYKVSSEQDWDYLEFYLNGIRLDRWSGEVGWQRYQFALPAGLNRLEWRYTKGARNAGGLDAAFIDNVDLPLIVPIDRSVKVSLNVSVGLGSTQFYLRGQVNQQYVIQASSDLISWTSISTNIAVNGILQVSEPVDPGGAPARFYRAVAQP